MLTARSDYELIQMSLKGHDDSFTELVNRYKNLVFSLICRHVRDREIAYDYAQDVFLKVYRHMETYSPEFKFSTWLMRITGNHIIDMHRKKKFTEVSYEEHAETSKLHTVSAENAFFKAEEVKRMENMVSELPEKYRIPVILFHKEGLSYQEIAETVGAPLSKIKNRIFRGRKILGAILAENTDGGV